MAQSLREMHAHWQNPPRPKIFAREILSRFARAVQIETERPRSASALQKNRVTDVRHRNRTLASRFYIVLALFGAARAFAGPAAQSFVPMLVPAEQFPQAVAWSSSTFSVAVIAGPALGGAIYILGPAVAYAVFLVLFVSIAIITMSIHCRSAGYSTETELTVLERLTAGIAYVWSRPLILGSFSLDLFAVLLGGATALLPIYARDILHVGPVGLGLLRSAPALGAAMLGFALGRMALQRNVGLWMFACVAIYGLATIVFGLSRNFALSMAALFILGA